MAYRLTALALQCTAGISAAAKFTLVALAHRVIRTDTNPKNTATTTSRADLARLTNQSSSTISRALRELERVGLIVVSERDGTTSRYELTIDAVPAPEPEPEPAPEPAPTLVNLTRVSSHSPLVNLTTPPSQFDKGSNSKEIEIKKGGQKPPPAPAPAPSPVGSAVDIRLSMRERRQRLIDAAPPVPQNLVGPQWAVDVVEALRDGKVVSYRRMELASEVLKISMSSLYKLVGQ